MSAITPKVFLRLLTLGAIWGASFLFMRIAVPALGPAWLISVRVLLAGLFLAGVALLWKRALPLAGNIKHYLVLGAFNTGIPFLIFAWAAQTTSASLLSIINSTAPMWGAVVAAFLTRSLPPARVFAGLLAGSIGVAILVVKDASVLASGSASTALITLLAPFCYGIASNYARPLTGKIDSFAMAHGSMWGALLVVSPTLALSPLPHDVTPLVVFATVSVGVLCTGIAYLMYFALLRDIGATSALTVTFLIPLFGILWGVLFLNEPFGWPMLAGGALVLLGTALVTGVLDLQKFRGDAGAGKA